MTDAELAAIEARYQAARSRGKWPSVDELTPIYLRDIPALIAALRELRAAARAALATAWDVATLDDPRGWYCHDCQRPKADLYHKPGCAYGALAALVEEP